MYSRVCYTLYLALPAFSLPALTAPCICWTRKWGASRGEKVWVPNDLQMPYILIKDVSRVCECIVPC